MNIRKEELVSFYTHLLGIPASLVGALVLVIATKESLSLRIIALIYILSAVFLFTASSLYHASKKTEKDDSIFRKIDHLAIFFMIAGTYTPFCFLYLEGPMRWIILCTQWSFVFLGLFFKLFYINAPRFLNTMIYIIMGWIAVIPVRQFVSSIPSDLMPAIIMGGIFYTAGALLYMVKWPKQIGGVVGFHEIFHIFILAGAVSHYVAVYESVKNVAVLF